VRWTPCPTIVGCPQEPNLSSSVVLALTLALQQPIPLLDGPPAPIAPEVITRDQGGHATIRAIKLAAPLELDGKLDEEVYQRERPFGGFIQVAPKYGEPQTERSDV